MTPATDAAQAQARRALQVSGLSFLDRGCEFFVRGRFGVVMSPAEVLTLAEQGRLR